MNRPLLLVLHSLIILTSCGSTKPPDEIKKYSNSKSLEAYDSLISMTANIYLISTQSPTEGEENGLSEYYTGAMSATGLDSNRISQKTLLAQREWPKLKSALYLDEDDGTVAACYTPHHGIAYYNDSYELIGYLEICFTCHQMKYFKKFPSIPNQPSELFSGLERFFESKGF